MEEKIIDCWKVVNELRTLAERLDDHPKFQDHVIALEQLYSYKFERLWVTFQAEREELLEGRNVF